MTPHNPSTKPGSRWVVIISDDAQVGCDLVKRWQTECEVPEFTSMTSEVWERATVIREDDATKKNPAPIPDCDYDLAIVGGVSPENLVRTLRGIPEGTPSIAILPPEMSPKQLRSEYPSVLPLRQTDDTLDTAVWAGAELLRRSMYRKRLAAAEQNIRDSQTPAALGRYMLECRHNLNNALTSVLGTAELLEMSGLTPVEEAREQVKTIYMMALRLQSLMQRFSAIETEMKMAEWQDCNPRGSDSRQREPVS